MSNGSQTCGPLYCESLEEFTGMDPKLIPVFASGFISGQAEKIYLGAAGAAMFRPSAEWFNDVFNIAHQVARRYGLLVRVLETSVGSEIWIIVESMERTFLRLPECGENSGCWHETRGRLCGIPEHAIDRNFHLRTGWGKPCDSTRSR